MTKISRRLHLLVTILTIGIFAFHYFMTNNRDYVWAKEFNEEVTSSTKKLNFKITGTEEITVDDIKLPFVKSIQLNCQKTLNEFGLMNYGQEFGQVISLTSDNKDENLNFKGWCLGDHVVGLEIEYKNLDDSTLNKVKRNVGRHFSNYTIIWTKM